jgi:WD40 repeat protein
VLTGSADKTLRKWDVGTCDCLYVLTGHTSVVYRMICTGDFIFSSSYDRTARCWDFNSGECIRVFRGHKRGVYPLIFMPADEDDLEETHIDASKDILITGSADFTARTWDFETGQGLKTFKGHKGAVTCMSVDPHNKLLFTGSTDFSIRSWHLYKGTQLKVFEGHQGSVICMQVRPCDGLID